MNIEKWERFKRVALGAEPAERPVALIVDSPWIPGYLGISTLDYISVPEVWLEANLRVEREFPEVTFLPGFWAEFGMCAEPSAFGCRLSFYANKTPVAHPIASSIEEAVRLVPPNPLADGLMPMALNAYRRLEPRVNNAGHVIKMVAARGPLTVATHLMGVTDFLLAMKVSPEETHRLLRTTTTLVRDWLDAQLSALKAPEAILVLDDIAGFMSAKDYLEFAHPYLKEIFDAFPVPVKMFHNDTDNPVSFKFLRELGIHVFNFTHLQPLDKVRGLVGPDLCLLGNVPPLDALAQGTPEQVKQGVRDCLARHPARKGLVLSAGGGTSPGTPEANIRALVEAAKETA
jgi:uroporphyrinogen-III decarboxylase